MGKGNIMTEINQEIAKAITQAVEECECAELAETLKKEFQKAISGAIDINVASQAHQCVHRLVSSMSSRGNDD